MLCIETSKWYALYIGRAIYGVLDELLNLADSQAELEFKSSPPLYGI